MASNEMTETPVRLNYTLKGEGEAVILMHGMFGSYSNLGMVSRYLADHYHTISVDLRNHGDSPHTSTMSYPAMAEDVLTLMDSLGLDRACLLGHSMGGKVAMQMALTYPERVAKLVVADISPVHYGARHDEVLDGLKALDEASIKSRNQAREILESFVSEPGVSSFLLKNVYRLENGEFDLKINLAAIFASYFDELTLPPTGQPFHGPVLFVKGENSPYIQDSHKEEILHLFPKATLKILAKTGHWLHAERPEAFNHIVRDFLAK